LTDLEYNSKVVEFGKQVMLQLKGNTSNKKDKVAGATYNLLRHYFTGTKEDNEIMAYLVSKGVDDVFGALVRDVTKVLMRKIK